MRKQKSIAEARASLPTLIREAEAGEEIELTRRGESVAVLLGREQYERLAAGTRRFSEAWDEFLAENDLTELDIDPDEIFAGARDASPGRDSDL
ncbi:MAG TPA: type II toxin-antitoxin system Phd/YefM family antitoxin [Thermoanaerobaculia bacterium]|nr:type II toxin-antitoxin system Phd/YefM family antitoxin [Thermoanaerobaculia bacterium]